MEGAKGSEEGNARRRGCKAVELGELNPMWHCRHNLIYFYKLAACVALILRLSGTSMGLPDDDVGAPGVKVCSGVGRLVL